MKCISCNEYSLKISEKRRLSFKKKNQLNPTPFICPNCGAKLCSTELSLWLRISELILFLLVSSVVIAEIANLLNEKYEGYLIGVLLALQLVNFHYICPNLMKLKHYQTLQDALPRSRTEGYLYFLILPAFSIIFLFFIAIIYTSLKST
jgi:hypothetical protein